MLTQILFALGLTGLTVILHGFGTITAFRWLILDRETSDTANDWPHRKLVLVRLVSCLLLLHVAEAMLWAVLYWVSGGVTDFETAVYFSLTSYTTVGYGDVVLPLKSRLLGPIEGAVGVLMFGWSTGVLVASLNRLYAGASKH